MGTDEFDSAFQVVLFFVVFIGVFIFCIRQWRATVKFERDNAVDDGANLHDLQQRAYLDEVEANAQLKIESGDIDGLMKTDGYLQNAADAEIGHVDPACLRMQQEHFEYMQHKQNHTLKKALEKFKKTDRYLQAVATPQPWKPGWQGEPPTGADGLTKEERQRQILQDTSAKFWPARGSDFSEPEAYSGILNRPFGHLSSTKEPTVQTIGLTAQNHEDTSNAVLKAQSSHRGNKAKAEVQEMKAQAAPLPGGQAQTKTDSVAVETERSQQDEVVRRSVSSYSIQGEATGSWEVNASVTIHAAETLQAIEIIQDAEVLSPSKVGVEHSIQNTGNESMPAADSNKTAATDGWSKVKSATTSSKSTRKSKKKAGAAGAPINLKEIARKNGRLPLEGAASNSKTKAAAKARPKDNA